MGAIILSQLAHQLEQIIREKKWNLVETKLLE